MPTASELSKSPSAARRPFGDIRKGIRSYNIRTVKVDDPPEGLVNEIVSHDIVCSCAVEADACAATDRCEQDIVFDYVAATTDDKGASRQ